MESVAEDEEELEVEPQAAMPRTMGITARAATNFFTAMSFFLLNDDVFYPGCGFKVPTRPMGMMMG